MRAPKNVHAKIYSMKHDVPDFLLRKPGRPYNPYSNWKTYKDKQIIFFSETLPGRWDVHPEGITEEVEGCLYVNGVSTYEVASSDFMWYAHPQGFLVREENKFLLNGTTLLYEGPWDDWRSHSEGVVIHYKDQLLFNGGGWRLQKIRIGKSGKSGMDTLRAL